MTRVPQGRLRSVLFAPADHPRRAQRLAEFGADAVVLDLEDAVADTEKFAARAKVPTHLESYRDVLRCVRVNGLATGLAFDDLAAAVCPALDCVVVPKIESAAELDVYDSVLHRLERESGLRAGAIGLLPIVETARGMLRVEEIAAAPVDRIVTLIFGIGDYTADLGIAPTPGAAELLYPRTMTALACRAARLPPPVDGPFLDIRDEEGYRRDARRSRDLGFQGRLAIHPSQVALANDVYSGLSADDLAVAQQIVVAFEAAEREGSASIQVDGRFVDYPIYRHARRQLDQHRAARAAADTGPSADKQEEIS